MNNHLYNDPAGKAVRRQLRENATDAERKLWNILRGRGMTGLKFFRQYGVGPYILDFYCPERRLAIEVDGGQHADFEGKRHDAGRDSYLKKLGIRVIRFWNSDVLGNTEGVGDRIREEVDKGS